MFKDLSVEILLIHLRNAEHFSSTSKDKFKAASWEVFAINVRNELLFRGVDTNLIYPELAKK